VLQILNQIVDLMLRFVGHVTRVSHVTGVCTQCWGTMQSMSPSTQTLGDVYPLSLMDWRTWVKWTLAKEAYCSTRCHFTSRE